MDGALLDSVTLTASQCDGCAGVPAANGTCYSHDVFHSYDSGNTYVLASDLTSQGKVNTDWASICTTDSRFVDDGFDVYDSGMSGSLSYSVRLMTDLAYDPIDKDEPVPPTGGGGDCDAPYWTNNFEPKLPIDWTHANSIFASMDGSDEVLDLSLRSWNQVLRLDELGNVEWMLSGDGLATTPVSPLTLTTSLTTTAAFENQHDAHAGPSGTLYLFDNGDSTSKSRALRMTVDVSAGTADIDRAWLLVNSAGTAQLPFCPTQGSAQEVPGAADTVALATCPGEKVIEELTDYDGNSASLAAPAMFLTLPTDACTTMGPQPKNNILGWHRGYPMDHVGDF
jgi:hypothetical protein